MTEKYFPIKTDTACQLKWSHSTVFLTTLSTASCHRVEHNKFDLETFDFHNTKEKTSKVKFSELTVKKYTEDKFEEIGNEIVLIENKNDICDISDTLISEATKDEIVKNPIYSLNGKDYGKKELYEMLPQELKDIVWSCRTPKYEDNYAVACDRCFTCGQMKSMGITQKPLYVG